MKILSINNKKLIYQYKNYIKVSKFDLNNKFIKEKNFHRIILNNASMVICENEKKEILLLKEYRVGLGKFSWGIPGGMIDKGETPKKAAVREIKEETGLKIKNLKLLLKYTRDGNYYSGKEYLYIAKVSKQKIKLSENNISKWANKKQLVEMIEKKNFETPGIQACIFRYLLK